MLTVNRLEAIMELESQLRDEYQQELDAKAAEIDRLTRRESELQATIDRQLESLRELTGKATYTARVKRRNRCKKLLAEMTKIADELQKSLSDNRRPSVAEKAGLLVNHLPRSCQPSALSVTSHPQSPASPQTLSGFRS